MPSKPVAEISIGDLVPPPDGRIGVAVVVAVIDHPPGRTVVAAYQPDDGSAIQTATTTCGRPYAQTLDVTPGFGCPHCMRVSVHRFGRLDGWCDACAVFWPRFVKGRQS